MGHKKLKNKRAGIIEENPLLGKMASSLLSPVFCTRWQKAGKKSARMHQERRE
jgi:hypothetical protein